MHTKTNTLRSIRAAALLLLGGSAASQAGTIYVNDFIDIYAYTTGGTRSVYSTQASGTVQQMAFNSGGTLYEQARDASAIYAIAPDGSRTTFATVNSPEGLAVDASGNIYTGANSGGTIMKYTPGGTASVFATGTSVFDLAFDPGGNLFASDLNQNIYEFAPDGTRTLFSTGTGGTYVGLVFDASGDLFATNWNGSTVDKFTPGGVHSVFATLPGSGTQLGYGITIDPSTGTLYVAEVANGVSNCCNQFVYAITSGGALSTFGTGLYDPAGIAYYSGAAAAPEPNTWLMMGAGVLAVVLKRRKA